MTTLERMKDIVDGAKFRFVAATNKTGAQMVAQGSMAVNSPSADGFAWRAARIWTGLFKPGRAHTRWPRQNDSALPIHELTTVKSDP
jgi:hypothetical protein